MTQSLTIHTAPLSLSPAGIVVIYVAEGAAPAGRAAELWSATGLDFARVATAAGFSGKQGQLLDIAAPSGLDAVRLFVLGAGKVEADKPAPPTAWSDRGGSLAAKLGAANAEQASVVLDGATPEEAAGLAAGLTLR
jgi:leucyl aminopeptidase